MKYTVQISDSERQTLKQFIGLPVHRVHHEHWDALTEIGEQLVHFVPVEVATPDETHRSADVTRPSFSVQSISPERSSPGLGIVSQIRIATTFLAYTQPEWSEAYELSPGRSIPAGMAYGPVFFSAAEADRFHSRFPQSALVQLDVAICIVTSEHRKFSVFTNGYSYNVFLALDAEPNADWSSFITHYEP